MRVGPWVMLMALCLCPPGCKSLGKRWSGGGKSGSGDTAAVPRSDPVTAGIDRTTPPTGATGFLAGQVIDGYNRHPAAATIQVVEAADQGGRAGAPIEVPADAQGFFTIHGLQPGKRYQVSARSRDGSRELTGTIVATPPDPRVLVRLTEDHAAPGPRPQPNNNPERPARPQEHAADPLLGAPSNNDKMVREPARNAESPAPQDSKSAPVERPLGPSPQASPSSNETRSEVRPENIANQSLARGETRMPAVFVPAWVAPERKADANNPESPAPREPAGPVPVPSCILTGNTLHNFALNDLADRSWQYRNRSGRLVLLDFWSTTCSPCLQALPQLNSLHNAYGATGLEIVGIAYEAGTPLEQKDKVNAVRRRNNIGYRLLLAGDGKKCPVKAQFLVRGFPTLVLLDESGKIIWQHEGNDPERLEELKIIIRQRLRRR